MKLSYEERKHLPSSDFADPKNRAYPIMDRAHARNALARVERFGTARQKRLVCSKVRRRFPSIHESHCATHDMRRLKA